MVHIEHALQQGMKKIEIRTVDTDIVIVLVGAFYDLRTQPLADIWVAFGTGKNYCFLSIKGMCESLGEHKSRALPVFHALTGCDTVSAFKGKQAWQAFEEVTDTFVNLSLHPFETLKAHSSHFKAIERLIVVLYDRTSPLSSVNDAREELFCKRSRSIERIPPHYFSIPSKQCIKQEFGLPACRKSTCTKTNIVCSPLCNCSSNADIHF